MEILLSLDYEMCNGINSGTVENSIIIPTDKLHEILKKHNAKAMFFVDVCFLLTLRKMSEKHAELKDDYNSIVSQIMCLSQYGHDIQLHIHPQWLHAKYENKKWESILDDYKLSDLSIEEVKFLFSEGIALLYSITGKPITTFRAGAYCLQTLKDYTLIFRDYNIIIDSSVLRNKFSKTEKWEWYDYRNPPCEIIYKFSDDILKHNPKGEFIEISIPTHKISIFDILVNKIKIKYSSLSNKPWADGTGSIGTLDKGFAKVRRKLKDYLKTHYIVSSIDGSNASFLDKFYVELRAQGAEFMQIMGHPKGLTPYSLDKLECFLSKLDSSDVFIISNDIINNYK